MPNPEELARQNIDALLAKFTELYNRARGKRCEMDGKPGGSMSGNESINVQHLTSNHLDPVARVTIWTLQRLYAILRGFDLFFENVYRKARTTRGDRPRFMRVQRACGSPGVSLVE